MMGSDIMALISLCLSTCVNSRGFMHVKLALRFVRMYDLCMYACEHELGCTCEFVYLYVIVFMMYRCG